MAEKKSGPSLEIGSFVKIRNSGYKKCRIVEYCGALGPGGAHIYRVMVRGKPNRAYIEVREDQIEPLEAQNGHKIDNP